MGRNGPGGGGQSLLPNCEPARPNTPAHFEASRLRLQSRPAARPRRVADCASSREGRGGGGDVETFLEVVRGPAVPQVGEDGAVGHGGALPPAALLRAARRHLRRRLLHRRRRCDITEQLYKVSQAHHLGSPILPWPSLLYQRPPALQCPSGARWNACPGNHTKPPRFLAQSSLPQISILNFT